MSEMSEQQFSDEDYHLLQEHHLGNPVRIYRLRPGYILFHRIMTLFLFLLCLVFVWVLASGLPRLYRDLSFSVEFLLWGGGFVFVLTMGWYGWTMCRHEEQSRRLLVGEDGLLEIRKMLRKKRLDVLHWNEIRGTRPSWLFPKLEHIVKRRRGEPCVLTMYAFQQGEELPSLVKEHEAEWYREEE